MKNQYNIAVIGVGTAGASSALHLSKMGHNVTVFERENEPKPVGAGIMLQATGLKLLSDFGLREKALELGTKIHAMKGENEKGKQVVDLSFENDDNLFGLGIHRGALFFLLFDKLKEENVPIELGAEIVEIQNDKTLIAKDGRTFGEFDLIIVANGSRSILRKQYSKIVTKNNEQNYAALWAKIPVDNSIFENKIHQFYEGSYKMMGFMPIGKPKNEDQEYVNFFWSIKKNKIEQWNKTSLEDWKAEMLELDDTFADVINSIESKDQVMFAPYMDVVMKPNYSSNVIFIGDASHPMSPQLSQGASFALLDSKYLVEALQETDVFEKAFKLFYKKRYKQIRYYQNLSRFITPMFQSDRTVTIFRDTLFKFMCSLKIFRKILLGTILGYRESLFKNLDKKYYI